MKANNIIFSLNHISPKRNNIHSPGTSVDATRHTEGKAVLNVVVAAASAAAAAVVVAVRQTDAQNGCLVGGWVGCGGGGGGRRRRMVVVVVMLMLMMGKIFPILYIQTPDRPPQRLLLVIIN